MSGMKENEGKPPMAWLADCYEALGDVARIFEYGAQKYEPGNWLKGIDPRLLYDALLRHAYRSAQGEQVDPEHGIDHLAAVAANALMLLTYRKLDMPSEVCYNKSRWYDTVSMSDTDLDEEMIKELFGDVVEKNQSLGLYDDE